MCECFCAVRRECDELQRISNKSMKELIAFFENKNSLPKPKPKFGAGAQFLFEKVCFFGIRTPLTGAVGRITEVIYDYYFDYVYTILFDNGETVKMKETDLTKETMVQIVEIKSK